MLATRENINIAHVGWAINIKFVTSEKVTINGKYIPKIGGSPLSGLRSDITNEMLKGIRTLPSTHYLTLIDKIVFVDTASTERDDIGLNDLPIYPNDTTTNYEIDLANKTIKVKGQITATESYSVAKVRLYSGSKLYFEYTLSTTQPVSNGSVYNVVYTITLSATDTSSGTNASAFSFDPTIILMKLAGVKASSTDELYTWKDSANNTVYLYLTINNIHLASTDAKATIDVTSLTPDSSQASSYIVRIKGTFTASSDYTGKTWNIIINFTPSTSSTSYTPSSDAFGVIQWQRAMDFSGGVGYTLMFAIQW
jgi:hypothetical protein